MKIRDIKGKGKGYGSLGLSDSSSKELRDILDGLGISGIIPDMHVTIMYDRRNPNIDVDIDLSDSYVARVVGIKELGEVGSKWYAIALLLESKELEELHRDCLELGYKHSYSEFVPHLSIKYEPTKEDIKILKDNINKFKGKELEFGRLKLEEIRE